MTSMEIAIAEAKMVRERFHQAHKNNSRGSIMSRLDAITLEQAATLHGAAVSACANDAVKAIGRGDLNYRGCKDAKNLAKWIESNKTHAPAAKKVERSFLDRVKGFGTPLKNGALCGLFAAAVASTITIFRCRKKDLSWTETMSALKNPATVSFFAGFFASLLTDGISTAIGGAATAIGVELAESVCNAVGGCFVGLILGSIVDAGLSTLRQRGQNQQSIFKAFASEYNKAFLRNWVTAIPISVVGFFSPAWFTIVFGVAAKTFDQYVHDLAEKRNQSKLKTLGQVLTDAVLFVPRVVSGWAAPIPDREYDDALVCDITDELLQDPVYLNGYFVEKAVAERQVRTGVGFYNEPITAADIKEVPSLRSVVRGVSRRERAGF
eukprot:INCI9382.2.p1 GENE.INCI9382.2~~INCI9382.2.p1  ORF type:complete len:380 (+),score=83.35 INCI9382.2:256-1395(+)